MSDASKDAAFTAPFLVLGLCRLEDRFVVSGQRARAANRSPRPAREQSEAQLNVEDPEKLGQPADPLTEARRRKVKPGDELTKPTHPLPHQTGDINPQRIILHLDGLVKCERLILKVEHQVGEGLGVPVEERRRRRNVPAADRLGGRT